MTDTQKALALESLTTIERTIGGKGFDYQLREIRAALEAKTVDAENAHDMIRYLLPLAKGYVAANPGIRSTETIIEDAEAMIAEAGRGKDV